MARRKWEPRDFSHIENPDARRQFDLYNELQWFLDYKGFNSIDSVFERLQNDVVRLTVAVIHDSALKDEYGDES